MTRLAAAPDGRSARTLRTRAAVVDAMLSLFEEGDLRPTARRIAERASVALRSVFQHFVDLESLLTAAADRQFERLDPLTKGNPPQGDLPGRVSWFVSQRCRLLEAITPVRRAALLQEPFSPEIARRLEGARRTAREETERTFTRELALAAVPQRIELLNGLDAASEWGTWEALRRHNRLSIGDSKKVMKRMIHALLKEATNADPAHP